MNSQNSSLFIYKNTTTFSDTNSALEPKMNIFHFQPRILRKVHWDDDGLPSFLNI